MGRLIGQALAEAAQRLCGVPFRLGGRDPQTGIDCVGLIECALRSSGIEAKFPQGYSLRNTHWTGLNQWADRLGFHAVRAPLKPGDICLCRPSPVQLHFAIVAPDGSNLIEAHAGLRRVVETPGPYPCRMVSIWRHPSQS